MTNCPYKKECTLYEHENGRCQFFYRLCSQYRSFEKEVAEAREKIWKEKDLVNKLRELGGL